MIAKLHAAGKSFRGVVSYCLGEGRLDVDGGGARWHFDHSSAAQRRRGVKSGKVRRARNAERDAAIVAAVRAGQSMRAAAKEWGGRLYTVQTVVARVTNEPNQLALGVAGGSGKQLSLV